MYYVLRNTLMRLLGLDYYSLSKWDREIQRFNGGVGGGWNQPVWVGNPRAERVLRDLKYTHQSISIYNG